MAPGTIRIGTSGWLYRHWRGNFYPPHLPQSQWFAHYRSVFSSVELNAPFYRLPTAHTVDQWHDDSGRGFSFSIKASRYITHNKKLLDPVPSLTMFFSVMSHLKKKMSVVLFQLPPQWGLNAERLEQFLKAYRRLSRRSRLCFEFRNSEWYCDVVYDLLRRYHAGFCIYNLSGHQSPILTTTDFAYVRLHGPEGKYSGEYGKDRLQVWARHMGAWRESGIDTYCYFDNDIGGCAPKDAAILQSLLKSTAASSVT